MKRIYVDFNTKNMDERERVYVNTRLHPELLDVLKEGERVVVYDEEVQMEAVLEYEADYGEFLGVLDWSTLKDLPTDTEPSLGPTQPTEEQSET
jgi:hypothetical protein